MNVLTLTNIVMFGGYIIAGVLVVLGMFGMQVRQRRGESDTVASTLINNLQASLKLTEDNLKTTMGRLDTTTKELHQMQGRNTVLEQLFNGSEGSILSFLKQAPELMRVAKENHEISQTNAAELKQLTTSINLLVTALTPKAA